MPSVQTISVSSSALFIIICMRYPRVSVTLCETKQVQKATVRRHFGFFVFPFERLKHTKRSHTHTSPVSHDFPHTPP